LYDYCILPPTHPVNLGLNSGLHACKAGTPQLEAMPPALLLSHSLGNLVLYKERLPETWLFEFYQLNMK
jgi:hypothetical protein